jgi:hypothetical protein
MCMRAVGDRLSQPRTLSFEKRRFAQFGCILHERIYTFTLFAVFLVLKIHREAFQNMQNSYYLTMHFNRKYMVYFTVLNLVYSIKTHDTNCLKYDELRL